MIDLIETSNFEVKNNRVSYNGRLNNHGIPFWGEPGGILLSVGGGRHLNMTTQNGTVHNNTVFNSPYEMAIYIDGEKNGVSNVDVYNNYLYRSTGINIAGECGGTISDIRIYNNVIHYSAQSGIRISTTNNCYDSVYVKNHPPTPGNGLKKNISIFNNTIFGTFQDGGRGIWIASSALKNLQVKNNIVVFVPVSQGDIARSPHYPTGKPVYYAIYTAQITRLAKDPMGYPIPASEIFSSNNITVNQTIYPMISQNTVCDTCSEVELPGEIVVDPRFIKSTIGVKVLSDLPMEYSENLSDLHLISLSPAIDAGVDLSSIFTTDFDGIVRPQGLGYDIGADEFASAVTTTLNSIFVNTLTSLFHSQLY